MARITLDFDGITDVIKEMQRLEKNVDRAVDNALQKAKEYVTPNVEKEMTKHVQTGKTKAAIDTDVRVQNDGVTAYVDVGFDISKEIQESGAPVSIFLMYGTPRRKPEMKKDTKLYNAVYGGKTKKEVQKIMADEFHKVLNEN